MSRLPKSPQAQCVGNEKARRIQTWQIMLHIRNTAACPAGYLSVSQDSTVRHRANQSMSDIFDPGQSQVAVLNVFVKRPCSLGSIALKARPSARSDLALGQS